MSFCVHCGQGLAAGARFCGSCGQRIDAEHTQWPLASAPLPSSDATPFGELTFHLSNELSDLMTQWIQTLSDGDSVRRDELWSRMLQVDPVNALRGVAAVMASLAESFGLDSGEVLVDLGLDAYGQEDAEGARSMWEEAARLGQGRALLYLFADARDAGDLPRQRRWQDAIRATGDADLLWAVANDHLSRGDMVAFGDFRRAAAAAGDPRANHSLAKQEIDGGQIEAGLSRLEPYARQGNPSVISTYVWTLLAVGRYAQAQSFGSDVMPAAVRFVAEVNGDADERAAWAEQLANARSNLALVDLSLGGATEDAVRTWNEGAVTGHPESLFYPLVIQWQQGRAAEAIAGYRALSPATRSSIGETVDELSTEQGWIQEWARVCQRFIDAAE